MFKRQSKPAAVSPLAPPSAPAATRNMSNGSIGSNSGRESYNPGMPVNRTGSFDTMKSDKSERRKSGFFGFGKKDKDKVEEPPTQQRSSFSVDRPGQSQPRPRQQSNDFQPHSMRQFPPPQPGRNLSQGRIVSSPLSSPSDFNPPQSQGFPKSQSMGFQSRPGPSGGVPETHPYRGYLTAQQEKAAQVEAQSQMSRSPSMPMNGNAGGSPSVERENMNGSPALSASPREKGAGMGGVGGGGEGGGGSTKAFDPIVELIAAQPQKTYVASPPELEMILARTSAGGQPKQGQPGSVSNDWDSVWLQLSGISLSMWSMKETRSAAAKGEKVPPTYFNITDSSLELLAPLPPPPHRPNSHPHHFVFSLNTAGSNRLLFSCPTERDLARWTTGLRLAAWERARLEEIYTGHLIKNGGREPKNELVRGRMEGWVRVRVMGGTDWKRLWVVLSTPTPATSAEDDKKNRRRSFFGMGDKQPETIQEPNTGVSMASFYLEPRTVKNKTSVAVLNITNITQAYAVFPERLEVMSQSNLLKVVGRIGGELVTIEGRLRDSGWALIMPESIAEGTAATPPAGSQTPLVNMMRWVTGFHDAFGLYGRPARYNWDQQDPKSLMFAYPQGMEKNQLFLGIEDTAGADFRSSSLGQIRAQFIQLVQRKAAMPAEEYRDEDDHPTPRLQGDFRLPPLPFDHSSPHLSEGSAPRSLTPITERTDIGSRTGSIRTQKSSFLMNERKLSESSVQKQSSGASSKPGNEERLAPIQDSTEMLAQYSEEPESRTPMDTPDITSPDSVTTSTEWSQPSAATTVTHVEGIPSPAPARPRSVQPPAAPLHVMPAADSGEISSATSPTAPLHAVPASMNTHDSGVLSPKPRRVSGADAVATGSAALNDEPAAMYLMNMVDGNQNSPPEQRQSLPRSAQARPVTQVSPPSTRSIAMQQSPPKPRDHLGAQNPPASNRLSVSSLGTLRDLSPERVRPTIITGSDTNEYSRNPNPETLGRKPSGARALPPKKTSAPRPEGLDPIGSEEDHRPLPISATHPDFGEDASAFMAYADQASPAKPFPLRSTQQTKNQEEESMAVRPAATMEQQRVEQPQRNIPGGGSRSAVRDNWSGSEDEDETEPDSPVQPTRALPPSSAPVSTQPPVQRMVSQTRALPPVPRLSNGYAEPSLPTPHERPRSRSPAAAPQRQLPQQPQQARQTVWNANFSSEHGMPDHNASRSSKFVDLEEPSAQLTKPFAPHGLLQAGIQDKEDRSAKKQEEVARETGSSLINMPGKPPPPSAGLLGAVAQHERDRKNAGGIGATLTDREREKRLGEERQRDFQRQQMEQMRQYGSDPNLHTSMYGGQYPPYGMNMGMMGMPPMPPMGYNPYQGGYNPYAQQQAMMAAQMAYQQAMMAMSQHGGSQHGGPGAGPDGQTPDRNGSPSTQRSSHHPGQSPSPNPPPFGYGMPPMGMNMPGSPWGMPWGSSSPGPGPGSASGSQSPWMGPYGMHQGGGGGGYDPNGERSRVTSMNMDNGREGRDGRGAS